jgi:hypothetical protein
VKPWTVSQAFQLMADDGAVEYVCNENNLAPPQSVGQ